MLRIEMLPARQGDALWIEYGDPVAPRRMLVDGGTEATWPVLRERIERVPAHERRLELVVITHVDADHIGGVLGLLADTKLGVEIGDVWFNGWRHLPGQLEPLGPVDGERLTSLLSDRPWNEGLGGRAVAVTPDGPLPVIELAGGLCVTVLGPQLEQLAALRGVWETVVRKAGLIPGEGVEPEAAERGSLEALGMAPVPDISALAAARPAADTAVANGSSIVLALEHDGRRVLLCADAFGATVRVGVQRLLAERGGSCLALSALKVPHHGSRRNVDLALLENTRAAAYLFSSDGTRTHHPDQEAVARVLIAHPGAGLWFNYRTSTNSIWGRPDVLEALGHRAFYPADGAGLVVECGALADET